MSDIVAGQQLGQSPDDNGEAESRKSRARFFLTCSAAVLLLLCVVGVCGKLFGAATIDTDTKDFRMFYSAAQMIRHGAGHSLYDLEQQHAFQQQYTHKIGLIFIYLPVSALLYLPVAWLPLSSAYMLWTCASFLVLIAAVFVLNAGLGRFEDPLAVLVLALVYVPIWFNIYQGQILLYLLLAYSTALYYMNRGREFAAGSALAVGLLKFHLVLPFVLVLLIRRRWRAIAGFSAGSVAVLALCVTVAGWQFFINYPGLLLHLPHLPLTGFHVWSAANLRGLFAGIAHREPPLLALVVVSLGLSVWSALVWRVTEIGFAITIVVSVLVSYHLNPQDLSLLFIPLLVLVKNARLLRWHFVPLALFAPPLAVLLAGPHFWMMGFCILVLLVALGQMALHARCDQSPRLLRFGAPSEIRTDA
jgi:hypothetical protein